MSILTKIFAGLSAVALLGLAFFRAQFMKEKAERAEDHLKASKVSRETTLRAVDAIQKGAERQAATRNEDIDTTNRADID